MPNSSRQSPPGFAIADEMLRAKAAAKPLNVIVRTDIISVDAHASQPKEITRQTPYVRRLHAFRVPASEPSVNHGRRCFPNGRKGIRTISDAKNGNPSFIVGYFPNLSALLPERDEIVLRFVHNVDISYSYRNDRNVP